MSERSSFSLSSSFRTQVHAQRSPTAGAGLLTQGTSPPATLRVQARQSFPGARGLPSRVGGQLSTLECDIKMGTLHGNARALLLWRWGPNYKALRMAGGQSFAARSEGVTMGTGSLCKEG